MKIQIKEEIGYRNPITYRNEKIRAALRKREFWEADIKAGCTPLDLAYYIMQNNYYEKKHKKALIPKKIIGALTISALRDEENGKENGKLFVKFCDIAVTFEKLSKLLSKTVVMVQGYRQSLKLLGKIWKNADKEIDFLNSLEEGEMKERYLKHVQEVLRYEFIARDNKTGIYSIEEGSPLYGDIQETSLYYRQLLKHVKDVVAGFELVAITWPELVGLISEDICRNIELITHPLISDEDLFYNAYRAKYGDIEDRGANCIAEALKAPKESKYLLIPEWKDITSEGDFAETLKNKIEQILTKE